MMMFLFDSYSWSIFHLFGSSNKLIQLFRCRKFSSNFICEQSDATIYDIMDGFVCWEG